MPTVNLRPNSDVSPSQWSIETESETKPLFQYLAINDGTVLGGHTPDDGVWIEAQSDGLQSNFGFPDTPSETDEVTEITVNVRGWIDDELVDEVSYIQVDLFHSSGTPVTGNPKTATATDFGGQRELGEVARTWSGLSLTKAQVDSLVVRFTLVYGPAPP